MERKYLSKLVEWLNDPFRKPLMVWGARQVGKSYLIKDLFAERYFKNRYVYIDCRTEQGFVSFCEKHINVEEVLNYISLDKGTIIDKNTLLIFDEAQECLPVVTLMKYFCQEHRDIPVIVTGSMVRIKIKRENVKRGSGEKNQFLFPIGNINQLTIYPMNFGEFLFNKNKLLYDLIIDSFNSKMALEDSAHRKALDIFYDYLLVGGMPEAVDVYLKTGSFQKSREILVDLYDNYLADMQLYQASPESIARAKKIFENIYTQLNKESKNFKTTLIGKKLKGRDVRSPIDWLSLAFLLYKSSLVKEQVTVPLTDSDESIFRLYLSDIGMFSYQSGINATTFISEEGRNSLSGIFFENYVASEIVESGSKLFYWKG
ncbi:MAG TPA: ATPase, partial [Firmicutes bacterium]|nr:ATPase [Bacillota bacterium]